MAHLRIFNSQTGTEGNPSVLYDQNASEEIQINFTTGVGDAFTTDENAPVAGEYRASTAVWELFGPDGPAVNLLVNDPNAPMGIAANPARFTPEIPGRWLVRLTVHKYVMDDNLAVVESASPEVFTALYEIQDPNIIGHFEARPYGNGAVSRGASTIAPNETTEYDSDEGWSRGIERYLATVSREQGLRTTAVVFNNSGVDIDAGKIVRPANQDALMKWKKCNSGLWDYQNTIFKVQTALATEQIIQSMPLFLCVEDIPNGERGVVIVSGGIPYDTTNLNNGAVLFVSDFGEITQNPAAATHPVPVGRCTIAGALDTADSPGSIYFHGHAHTLPGLVKGPLTSTDNAIATWDGNAGDKLKNTKLLVQEGATDVIVSPTSASPNLHIESGENQNGSTGQATFGSKNNPAGHTGHIEVISGDAILGTSGNAHFGTGNGTVHAGETRIFTGTSSAGASGAIYMYTGSAHTAGEIHILGGDSTDDTGPNVTLSAGTSHVARGGDLILKGGDSAIDGGDVRISGGDTVNGSNGDVLITAANNFKVNTSGFENRAVITQFLAKDMADPNNPEKMKALLTHIYNVQSAFSLFAEDGTNSVHINSDTHSFFKRSLSIGTENGPGQQPNLADQDIFHVEGNGFFTNLTIQDKLNVGGLIDPTGLVLSHNDASSFPQFGNDETVLYVSDGTDGVTVAGHLYQSGPGGLVNLTQGAQGGAGQIASPGPNTTRPGQVATWTTTDGDSLAGSGINISPDAEIRSNTDTQTDLAKSISIEPGNHVAAGDNNGADMAIYSGRPTNAGHAGVLRIAGAAGDGGEAGPVLITGGDSAQNTSDGGRTTMFGGAGCQDIGNESDGGTASIGGGVGGNSGGRVSVTGGDSIDSNGDPGIGDGGGAILSGGVSGRNQAFGGLVDISGGQGASGSNGQYLGGAGGDIFITAGNAGPISGAAGGRVEIHGGKGDTLDPISGFAGSSAGGEVVIKAGDSADNPAANMQPSMTPGANVYISGGDAGLQTEAPGGDIFIEPGAKDSGQPPGGAPAMGWNGNLYLCHQDQGGFQKSWVVIGNKLLSGQPHDIGMCAGKPAHTIHGDLKVTGVIDPTALFFEPQTSNPVETQLVAAEANGELDTDGNPIDANSVESQQKINNAIWFDANNADQLTIGSEPVGTPGTVVYSHVRVSYEASVAVLPSSEGGSGHLTGDLSPEVYYFDVPERVSRVTVDSTLGDIAIMLPAAEHNTGRSIVIKDYVGKSNVPGYGQILICPADTDALDQYSYYNPYPLQPWEARECWSDGENWFLM